MYMEGIKYVNLIEIDPVVIEIRGVENGKLAAWLSWPLTHAVCLDQVNNS